jgi:hypothetical protein
LRNAATKGSSSSSSRFFSLMETPFFSFLHYTHQNFHDN